MNTRQDSWKRNVHLANAFFLFVVSKSLPVASAIAAVAFLAVVGALTRYTCASERPNIVFILADDLGWRDIGYHQSDIKTPHLDRLAAGGIRLDQHYVYPVCSPTRVGLLTGRGPSRFGVLTPLGDKQVLPHDLLTLPRGLQEAGYATHISGKWHIGSVPAARPLHYGFNTTYGYLRGQVDPYTHRYKNGDRTWHRNDQLIEEEGHVTDLITDEAIRIVQLPHARPFFLYVAYSVPHYPLSEPARWTDPYADAIHNVWRARFAASVSHMDDGVGRIVAALDASGQRSKTLLVFASDNGGQKSWNAPATQYSGRYKPHTTLGNNLPLRGWKGDLHEGGIRVPAFVNWPGHIAPGQVEVSPISILDWMPTLFALAGFQPAPDAALEGMDIWPLLMKRAVPKPRSLYWHAPRQAALRHGDWKVVTDLKFQHAELFNLAVDPNEKSNLATAQSERVREMLQELKQQIGRDPTK